MEKRGGTYTSQTKKRDAEEIASLARKIMDQTDDPQIEEWARKIRRAADGLAREL
jgi:hypothetical protein